MIISKEKKSFYTSSLLCACPSQKKNYEKKFERYFDLQNILYKDSVQRNNTEPEK